MAPEHSHGETHHHKELHDSHHRHGAHAYDVRGHQLAIVNGDPNTLGHWHFDSPFEHVALAAICDFSEEFTSTIAPFINWGLNHLPQAARPPPALV